MGVVANLRGPQGNPGTGTQLPFLSLAGQVDTSGAADETSTVQSAVDSLPSYGGCIMLPAGQIKLGEVTLGSKAVELVGQGGTDISQNLGHGATEVLVPDGMVGVRFVSPGGFIARGPIIRNISFRPAGAAPLSGFRLDGGVESGFLDNVSVSEAFTDGGVKIDGGTQKRTMYFTLRDCLFASPTGLWVRNSTGVQVRGGTFDAKHNLTGVVPGTIGLLIESSDTPSIVGARFCCYETHINSSAPDTYIAGTRHEGFGTAIVVSGDHATILPGSIQNWSAGGAGTGIKLAAGDRHFVNANPISSVAVRVDYGTATNYTVFDLGTVTMPGLPGTDPHIKGRLYNQAGTVKFSTG